MLKYILVIPVSMKGKVNECEESHTRLLSPMLLEIVGQWRPLSSPSLRQWVGKLWWIQIMKFFTTLKQLSKPTCGKNIYILLRGKTKWRKSI